MYHRFARMAREPLVIFLSSMPDERQFSIGRDLCFHRRSKLQGLTIEKVMVPDSAFYKPVRVKWPLEIQWIYTASIRRAWQ